MVYGNKEIGQEVTRRSNIPAGFKGGTLFYVVPANRYFSEVSQEAADQMAMQEFAVGGAAQEYADKHAGLVPSVYYSSRYEKEYKKQGCPLDKGNTVIYVVPEGKFISNESQEDADAKAAVYADEHGQKFANQNGACCEVYLSRPLKGRFYSSTCPNGTKSQKGVVFTLPEGFVISEYSQSEADSEARVLFEKEGQKYADANDTCYTIYLSQEVSGWFKPSCKKGYVAKEKYYSLPYGAVTSFISEDDANEMALKLLDMEGQKYADAEGDCMPEDLGAEFNV